MKKRFYIPLLTIVLIFSCFQRSEGIKRADIPALFNQFLIMHVQYHNITDEISERTLNNYITALDYGKYYFYKSDVEKFREHKHKLAEYNANNDYTYVFNIFETYKKRFKENQKLVEQLLKQQIDFNKDETILIDAEKIPYAKNKEEMKERWRKNIKLQLLNYMSITKNLKGAKEKLRKKYGIMEKRLEEMNEDKVLTLFINSFTMALDPHSNFLAWDEHQDFKISMELKLEGIGVRLMTDEGFVTVESIIPGGAADKLPEALKLKPRDKIIAVSQGKGEAVDVIDMDLRDVVKKIRGKRGTEVRLTVLRSATDGKVLRFVVPIVREEIKLQDSEAKGEVFKYSENLKIGYVKLPSFYSDRATRKSSSRDLAVLLNNLNRQNVSAVVLDLRSNPGGLLDEATNVAGLFLHSGPVLQLKDASHAPQVFSDRDTSVLYEGPMVVLIDKFSASASEILAGAIKDYRRGIIIGPTNTFGKGTVQSYNVLPFEKGAIKITTAIFYQPEGTSNQLYGIAPDVVVPDITAIWDYGEDKTKYPLNWKKIPRADYNPYQLVNPSITSSLNASSRQRIAANEDFRKLNEKIAKFKKQLSNKVISLKEESIIEKQREKEMEKSFKKESNAKLIDLKNDLFLKEAFDITSDYLKLLGK